MFLVLLEFKHALQGRKRQDLIEHLFFGSSTNERSQVTRTLRRNNSCFSSSLSATENVNNYNLSCCVADNMQNTNDVNVAVFLNHTVLSEGHLSVDLTSYIDCSTRKIRHEQKHTQGQQVLEKECI